MENCENLVNKLEYIPVECICVLTNDELVWKKSTGKKPIVGDITNKLVNINLNDYFKDKYIKIPKKKWDFSVKLNIHSYIYYNKSVYKLAILKDFTNNYVFVDRNINLIKECIKKFKNSSSYTAKLTHTPSSNSSYVVPSSSLSAKNQSSKNITFYKTNLEWSILSGNKNAVTLLEQKIKEEKKLTIDEYNKLKDTDKIDWDNLSLNENAIKLLEENKNKIEWALLSMNKGAIKLIKEKIEKESKLSDDEYNKLKISDKIDWSMLSGNLNAIDLLKQNLNKINWDVLSSNPNAIELLKNKIEFNKTQKANLQYHQEINWEKLSGNENAIDLLKTNLTKINWKVLSQNKNGIKLLEENLHEIRWEELCQNENAIKLLEENKDKINWALLSMNKSAVKLIEEKIKEENKLSDDEYNKLKFFDKIDWNLLSGNPNAIKLLEENKDKINWDILSKNKNAIELLKKNPEKISWDYLSENENVLKLFYDNLNSSSNSDKKAGITPPNQSPRKQSPGNKSPMGAKQSPGNKSPMGAKQSPGNKSPMGTKQSPGNKSPMGTKQSPGNKSPMGVKQSPGNKSPMGTKQSPGNKSPMGTKLFTTFADSIIDNISNYTNININKSIKSIVDNIYNNNTDVFINNLESLISESKIEIFNDNIKNCFIKLKKDLDKINSENSWLELKKVDYKNILSLFEIIGYINTDVKLNINILGYDDVFIKSIPSEKTLMEYSETYMKLDNDLPFNNTILPNLDYLDFNTYHLYPNNSTTRKDILLKSLFNRIHKLKISGINKYFFSNNYSEEKTILREINEYLIFSYKYNKCIPKYFSFNVNNIITNNLHKKFIVELGIILEILNIMMANNLPKKIEFLNDNLVNKLNLNNIYETNYSTLQSVIVNNYYMRKNGFNNLVDLNYDGPFYLSCLDINKFLYNFDEIKYRDIVSSKLLKIEKEYKNYGISPFSKNLNIGLTNLINDTYILSNTIKHRLLQMYLYLDSKVNPYKNTIYTFHGTQNLLNSDVLTAFLSTSANINIAFLYSILDAFTSKNVNGYVYIFKIDSGMPYIRFNDNLSQILLLPGTQIIQKKTVLIPNSHITYIFCEIKFDKDNEKLVFEKIKNNTTRFKMQKLKFNYTKIIELSLTDRFESEYLFEEGIVENLFNNKTPFQRDYLFKLHKTIFCNLGAEIMNYVHSDYNYNNKPYYFQFKYNIHQLLVNLIYNDLCPENCVKYKILDFPEEPIFYVGWDYDSKFKSARNNIDFKYPIELLICDLLFDNKDFLENNNYIVSDTKIVKKVWFKTCGLFNGNGIQYINSDKDIKWNTDNIEKNNYLEDFKNNYDIFYKKIKDYIDSNKLDILFKTFIELIEKCIISLEINEKNDLIEMIKLLQKYINIRLTAIINLKTGGLVPVQSFQSYQSYNKSLKNTNNLLKMTNKQSKIISNSPKNITKIEEVNQKLYEKYGYSEVITLSLKEFKKKIKL